MTHRRGAIRFLASLGVLILAGCSTTTMQSMEVDRDFDAGKVHQMLVISLQPNEALRRTIEVEFCQQFARHHITALPAVEALPGDAIWDRSAVIRTLRKQHLDAVLVTRLIDRKDINAEAGDIHKNRNDNSSWQEMNSLQIRQRVAVASPQYDVSYDVAVVSASVYDVPSDQPVWTGILDLVMTQDLQALIPGVVKMVIKNIYAPH